MKTNEELMDILAKLIPKLHKQALAGDKGVHIKWAMASAIHKTYLETGFKLTDLPWFIGTPYYTGSEENKIDGFDWDKGTAYYAKLYSKSLKLAA